MLGTTTVFDLEADTVRRIFAFLSVRELCTVVQVGMPSTYLGCTTLRGFLDVSSNLLSSSAVLQVCKPWRAMGM